MATWVLPAAAWGNAGPPTRGPGPFLAEPVGIKDVEIVHEHLTIDFRPIAGWGPAVVDAVYQLRNRGLERSLDLVFVTGGSGDQQFQVSLGDRSIPTRPVEGFQLPAPWQPPATTPDIYLPKGVPYDVGGRGSGTIEPMAFTLLLAPGSQTLRVRYVTHPLVRLRGHDRPMLYHQLAYVLAPARSWAGFGGLDVTVQLPPGWRAASAPALEREGDTLKGGFSELPADALALTLQAPEGWTYTLLKYGCMGLFALASLGGGVLCWYGGRSKGRCLPLPGEPRPSWLKRHAWPRSLGLGCLWSMAFGATALLALLVPARFLPADQQSDTYWKAWAALGAIALTAPLFIVGFVVALSAAQGAHHRRFRPDFPSSGSGSAAPAQKGLRR